VNASGNGNWSVVKKIVIGIVTVLITALVTQVLMNTNRITAVETEIKSIKDNLYLNRTENREEHQVIRDKIDALSLILLRKEGDK
jgi:hypothetical protein